MHQRLLGLPLGFCLVASHARNVVFVLIAHLGVDVRVARRERRQERRNVCGQWLGWIAQLDRHALALSDRKMSHC